MRVSFRYAATIAAALAVLLSVSSPATGAQPQSSDFSIAATCSGTLIEARAIKKDSTTLGNLYVYWDGTYNCARTVSSKVTWGVAKPMGARIASCPLSDKGTSSCRWIDNDEDYGTYRYYAGPVKVDGVGRCIAAKGSIKWNGTWYSAKTSPWVGHCD